MKHESDKEEFLKQKDKEVMSATESRNLKISNMISDGMWDKLSDSLTDADGDAIGLLKKIIELYRQKGVSLNEIRRVPYMNIKNSKTLLELVIWEQPDVSLDYKSKCMHFLLKEGADVNVKTGFYNAIPLHYAAAIGHVEAIKELLNRGANLHQTDDEGWTPLHWAANNKLASTVALVEAGADLNIKNKDGDLPINCAENDAVVDYLKHAKIALEEQKVLQDLISERPSELPSASKKRI